MGLQANDLTCIASAVLVLATNFQKEAHLRYELLGVLEPDMVVMFLSIWSESELFEVLPETT